MTREKAVDPEGDKLTVTVERIDGGKLRATCGTWDDAVVVLPDRVLTLSNHERSTSSAGIGPPSADTPRSREVDFEAPDEGGGMTREKAVDPEGDKLTVTVSASTASSCAGRAGRASRRGGRHRSR